MMTDESRRQALPTAQTLYAQHGAQMFHYALTFLGAVADVEDVMQEVFLKAKAGRRKVARARSPRAYLFAMLRHEMMRFTKRKMRRAKRVAVNPTEQVEFLEAPAEEGVSEEDAREVERALGRLPDEQREVVVLKVYEGLTFREIGEVMKTSMDTAASRYRYGIDRLRALLSHKFE